MNLGVNIILQNALDNLYEILATNKYECPNQCCKCCGPVSMSKLESLKLGLDRMYTKGKGKHGDTCEFVNDETGKCDVYENRPFICRFFNSTWSGVFKCAEVPQNGFLSPTEATDILQAYFKLVEQEGYIEEFMKAIEKTHEPMIRREIRNGWDSRVFEIETKN